MHFLNTSIKLHFFQFTSRTASSNPSRTARIQSMKNQVFQQKFSELDRRADQKKTANTLEHLRINHSRSQINEIQEAYWRTSGTSNRGEGIDRIGATAAKP